MQKNIQFFATAKDAIKSTGLDYNVIKVPILFKATDSIPGIKQFDDVPIDNKFATVRIDTQEALGIVGNVYQIVQNEEAFEAIDLVAKQQDLLFKKCWQFNNGSKIVVQGEVGNGITMETDELERTVLLINSHDGSKKVSVKFTIYNKTNKSYLSFSLPNLDTEYELKHTTHVSDRIEEGNKIINAAFAAFTEVELIFKKMIERNNLDVFSVEKLVRSIVDPKNTQSTRSENVIQAILGFLNMKDNISLWNIYNAVTEYADNVKNSKKKEEELRVHSSLFGSGETIKLRAFETLVKVL